MSEPTDGSVELTDEETEQLRQKHYNGTIVGRRDIHDDLAIFRVKPDNGFSTFKPGQYVALGLGNWEARIEDSQAENLPPGKNRKLVRRAYSISCPMCDSSGNLLRVNDVEYLEFYVALVRYASEEEGKTPGLTPRLFLMQEGDRLEVAKKIVGHYVVEGVSSDDTILLIGTGTGEAPHNAMVTELLANGHRGIIANLTSVRGRNDLAYLQQHQLIAEKYSNYRYLPVTTREPENLDASHPGYIGKRYVQDYFRSGQLASDLGVDLSPATTHVFLCGNPAMIGYTPPGATPPSTPGMLQVLREFGFSDDDDQAGVGTVRFEKYW